MELPSSVYIIVGVLVLGNLGTIITVIVTGAKGIWWLSALNSRVEKNTHDINAAHEKIREVSNEVKELRT